MRINYNVTGTQRKEMVEVISSTVGIRPVYRKMPTCNYASGNIIVAKDGGLEWDDRTSQETIDQITEALAISGFEPESQDSKGTEAEESTEEQEETVHDALQDENTGLTIEIPLNKVAVGTLTNILEAKGSLIKKALGINDLRFEIRDDRIAFPWFDEVPDADEMKAYTEFISLLCKHSKELKRANAAERPVTNEKYAFRCFLLRLGFIGNEYKTSRKILLRNLSGNSSWKDGAPEKEAVTCE